MQAMVDYEQQRNARLLENQKRMEALGLLNLSKSLAAAGEKPHYSRSNKTSSSSTAAKQEREGLRARAAAHQAPPRRSSRLSGAPQPSYKESDIASDLLQCSARVDSRHIQPEIYTEEHEKLLGSCTEDWELFKDGYGADGTRIYDAVNGKTCHQCRQKTLGLRTWCSQCESLRGQFCGDCLFMRYGENVREALKNSGWICPPCRGICNCSFCRLKKGWAPTGSMYRLASELNYKSVAHYLILTRREGAPDERCEAVGSAELSKEEGKQDTRDPDDKAQVSNVAVQNKIEVEEAVGSSELSKEEGKQDTRDPDDKAQASIVVPQNKTEVEACVPQEVNEASMTQVTAIIKAVSMTPSPMQEVEELLSVQGEAEVITLSKEEELEGDSGTQVSRALFTKVVGEVEAQVHNGLASVSTEVQNSKKRGRKRAGDARTKRKNPSRTSCVDDPAATGDPILVFEIPSDSDADTEAAGTGTKYPNPLGGMSIASRLRKKSRVA